MHAWLQQNPSVQIGFAERARDLVPVTRETINFLLIHDALSIDEVGRLRISSNYRNIRVPQNREEVRDYYTKAAVLGRWFARVRSASTAFAMWGVRP